MCGSQVLLKGEVCKTEDTTLTLEEETTVSFDAVKEGITVEARSDEGERCSENGKCGGAGNLTLLSFHHCESDRLEKAAFPGRVKIVGEAFGDLTFAEEDLADFGVEFDATTWK